MYDTTVSKTLDIYRDVEIEILCRPFTLRDKASASIAPLQLSIFATGVIDPKLAFASNGSGS